MNIRSKLHSLAIALSALGVVVSPACGVSGPADDDPAQGAITQSVTTPTAQLYNPATGSILLGASVTLSWTFGTTSDEYWVYLGNSFGTADIYSSGPIAPSTTSIVVSSLPTDGRTIYAVMWSHASAGWTYNIYSFTAATAGSGVAPAQLISPSNGSTLQGGTNMTFSWTPGTLINQYGLMLGSSPGQGDILVATIGGTSGNIAIPTFFSNIYVQLWSHTPAGWLQALNYSFTVQ